jgi:hypothetical protein
MLTRHVTSLTWCGILILCLAICIQLLGAPGTLFDFADSDDDFQASVVSGYTVTSGTTSCVPSLRSFFGFTEMASIPVFLRPYNFFHPPLSV